MRKKIPQRMCVGCGEMKFKKELIRIVKNKEGEVFYDPSGRANGRGAYICKNVKCFDAAIANKKLDRTFNQPISEEFVAKLKEEIFNGQ
ncbi:RNase P modulator RnpM [Garciella nitratireducens]|uniref:RNase P modulator RnpM n=1 Tax=Garciella nitratireducens TaxID=218205 RepID=UPI000DE8DE8F|nr:YlxR family protein [Garciella nitratireducens]RBP41167.1 hypothetical protein DFR81_11163 [Garciella nitratireducens]